MEFDRETEPDEYRARLCCNKVLNTEEPACAFGELSRELRDGGSAFGKRRRSQRREPPNENDERGDPPDGSAAAARRVSRPLYEKGRH